MEAIFNMVSFSHLSVLCINGNHMLLKEYTQDWRNLLNANGLINLIIKFRGH